MKLSITFLFFAFSSIAAPIPIKFSEPELGCAAGGLAICTPSWTGSPTSSQVAVSGLVARSPATGPPSTRDEFLAHAQDVYKTNAEEAYGYIVYAGAHGKNIEAMLSEATSRYYLIEADTWKKAGKRAPDPMARKELNQYERDTVVDAGLNSNKAAIEVLQGFLDKIANPFYLPNPSDAKHIGIILRGQIALYKKEVEALRRNSQRPLKSAKST